jgi:hypothetical protein
MRVALDFGIGPKQYQCHWIYWLFSPEAAFRTLLQCPAADDSPGLLLLARRKWAHLTPTQWDGGRIFEQNRSQTALMPQPAQAGAAGRSAAEMHY